MDIKTKALQVLDAECKDLLHYKLQVPQINFDPDDVHWPLKFHREYVSKNMPVLIKNVPNNKNALDKWNQEYLCNKLGGKEVIVAVTPNGYADGLTSSQNTNEKELENEDQLFVLPDEVKMQFTDFIEHLNNQKPNYICYIQKQDSNFTEDFKELFEDVEIDIQWAHTTFGKSPDAVNFWMGDSRAITSMHKDFYENIYCVIDGFKDFILIPPTDLPKITYKQFKVGKYCNVTPSTFSIALQKDDEGVVKTVPWIADDPLDEQHLNGSLKNANLYHVRVEKGDCLYLPSLWFHHVRQSHGCIAINYWYDMEFDVKYCYYKLLESLVKF